MKRFFAIALVIMAMGVMLSYGQTTTELDLVTTVAEEANWAEHVTITIEDGMLTFESNGLPDHEVLDVYQGKSLNGTVTSTAGEIETRFTIPLVPELADEPTEANQGTIGFVVNGAVFFNPFEGGGDSDIYAVEDNFEIDGIPFIDACNGHPEPSRISYHYHGVPVCTTDVLDTEGEHSVLIGYLLDGFPVYGPQDIDGEHPEDLDDCNGHFGETPEFPDGIYHYHMTLVAPYSVPCYMGVVDTTMMPGGNGGPPPSGNGGPPSGNNGAPPPDGTGGRPPGGNGAPPPGGNGGRPPGGG